MSTSSSTTRLFSTRRTLSSSSSAAEEKEASSVYHELSQLAESIRHHDELYYNEQPILSDDEYDALVAREAQLCRAHPELQTKLERETGLGTQATRFGGRVGPIILATTSTTPTTFDSIMSSSSSDRFSLKRSHGRRMLSLDNVVEREQLDAWLNRVAKAAREWRHDSNKKEEETTLTLTTEPKLDGLSLSLRYKLEEDAHTDHWTLEWAATRGDGRLGQDVSSTVLNNLETLGIPGSGSFGFMRNDDDNTTNPKSLEVRGEIVFPNSIFYGWEEPNRNFSNPRNAASGILLRKEDLTGEAQKLQQNLRFYAYDLVMLGTNDGNDDGNEKGLEEEGNQQPDGVPLRHMLKDAGFTVPEPFVSVELPIPREHETIPASGNGCVWSDDDLSDMLEYYHELDLHRQKKEGTWSNLFGDYDMDGIVHKVSNSSLRTFMGESSRAPRWAAAQKFPAQAVVTKLLGIEVQVGRTGALTPVALLEPVDLNGVNVSRATLHNFPHLQQVLGSNNRSSTIPVGTAVVIRRAGDVVPQVVERVGSSSASAADTGDKGNKSTNQTQTISLCAPDQCPACGSPVETDEANNSSSSAGKVLRCAGSPLLCKPRATGALAHAFSRDALNVKGLSQKRLEQLLEEGLIRVPSDLFVAAKNRTELVERVSALKGWGNRSAEVLADTANKVASDGVSLSRFFQSLGIRFCGKGTSELVEGCYDSMDDFLGDLKSVSLLAEPHEESFPRLREDSEETKGIGPTVLGELTKAGLDDAFVDAVETLAKSITIQGGKRKDKPSAKPLRDETTGTNNNGPFEGLSVVFTGSVPGLDRTKSMELAKRMGAKSTPKTVSKSTGVLVHSPGGKGKKKLEQAEAFGVRVITADEFLELAKPYNQES